MSSPTFGQLKKNKTHKKVFMFNSNGEKNSFASIQFQALNNNRKQTHRIEMKPRVK